MSELTLDQLRAGGAATVVGLTSTGVERRRLMDLGIVPGARIEIVMSSPLGDPVAYRIRGATVALRRDQARHIEVTLEEKG